MYFWLLFLLLNLIIILSKIKEFLLSRINAERLMKAFNRGFLLPQTPASLKGELCIRKYFDRTHFEIRLTAYEDPIVLHFVFNLN